MDGGKFLHQSQTETPSLAALVVAALGLVVSGEYVLLFFGGNTYAGIGNGDAQMGE